MSDGSRESIHRRNMDLPHASVSGLYAITPDHADSVWLERRVEQALEGGARLLQYRSKNPDRALRWRQVRALAALCRRHGALFIVNDDVELARLSGADGVHLGRDDESITAARARLGQKVLIGASCYDDLALAQRCVDAGADYLAFGSFFASQVKPVAARPSLELLGEARGRWAVPLVAIGGVTLATAPALLAAGADALAVISALFQASDTRRVARAFARLCDSQPASARTDVLS